MTLVTFAPVGNGTTTPRGYIEGRPVGFGTLPDSFRAALVDGAVTVEVEPTGLTWCWNFIERVDYGRDEYATVTDVVGPVTYASLTKVNGDDFSPTVTPSAGWQAALDLKAPKANPTFTGTVSGVTKAHVGLSNVDNTSDADKPVSIAQAAADALLQPIATLSPPVDARIVAATNVTIAGVKAAVRGNRVAFLGDSIMCAQGSDPMTSPHNYGLAMPSYLHYLSKGCVLKTRQAGVAGNTAAQMLARFDTDVTPYRPSVVVIMAGTNDTNDASPTSLASYITTMRALVAKVRAIGAQPVLSTIPPNVISVARQSRTTQFNAWIKAYCAGAATDGAGGWATEGAGIPCPDTYSFFTDPTAGGYLSTYLLDGTHPNNPGYTGWAAFMWAQLSSFFPVVDPLLPADNIDPNNLLSNGLNLTTTGSGTSLMPTGWTVQSGVHPSGVTGSLVTGDTTIKGNWWRVVADGSASATNNESQTVSGNYAVGHPLAGTPKIVPGHKYAHTGRFKATGLRNADTGSGSSFLLGTAFNSTLNNSLYDFRAAATHFYDVAEGVYYQEMVAPSDASSALVRRQLLNTTAGAGTFQVAQSGFYDLTAMGLA